MLIYFLDKRRADLPWLMLIVGSLDANHKFFTPEYEPPPRVSTAALVKT